MLLDVRVSAFSSISHAIMDANYKFTHEFFANTGTTNASLGTSRNPWLTLYLGANSTSDSHMQIKYNDTDECIEFLAD